MAFRLPLGMSTAPPPAGAMTGRTKRFSIRALGPDEHIGIPSHIAWNEHWLTHVAIGGGRLWMTWRVRTRRPFSMHAHALHSYRFEGSTVRTVREFRVRGVREFRVREFRVREFRVREFRVREFRVRRFHRADGTFEPRTDRELLEFGNVVADVVHGANARLIRRDPESC